MKIEKSNNNKLFIIKIKRKSLIRRMKWNLFGKKEERNNELQYVHAYSDALTFAPFVSNYAAMALSAVYRAVDLISDSIAMLPVKVQQLDKENGKNQINHPLNIVFGDKNNGNNISKFNLIKLLIQSVLLRGNGFAYIERAQDGTVTGLRYLEAQDVIINYNKYTDKLYYSTTAFSQGKKMHIEPINMLHLLKNSYDGISGISVLSYAARTIKTSSSTEQSAQSFFENGCNLSGILTVNGQVSAKQKEEIRSSWRQAYNNGGNGLAVIPGNMSYQAVQVNAADAQMLESRQYNVQDIARFFGISPVLLGDLSHASYSTIEAVQNEFLLHTLQPYITMIENEFNRKLLKPSENKLEIILETNEILRVDKQAQANYYSTMINNGVLTRNEVRKELGYNPVEGGDTLIVPFTDISQNTIGGEENKEDNKEENTNEE